MMEQRLDLGERPRRRNHRVTAEPLQRLDAQVAVDQHEPVRVVDHDHRHLLPDLSDRADQPPPLLGIVDPKIAMTELELVEVDVHAPTLNPRPPTTKAGP